MQEVVVCKADVAAQHVVRRTEAGVADAVDVVEFIDTFDVLLDRAKVAQSVGDAPIVVVEAGAQLCAPRREAELALEGVKVLAAVFVDEQRRALEQAVGRDVQTEVDRAFRDSERVVEREVHVDAARLLRVAVDESAVEQGDARICRVA